MLQEDTGLRTVATHLMAQYLRPHVREGQPRQLRHVPPHVPAVGLADRRLNAQPLQLVRQPWHGAQALADLHVV